MDLAGSVQFFHCWLLGMLSEILVYIFFPLKKKIQNLHVPKDRKTTLTGFQYEDSSD